MSTPSQPSTSHLARFIWGEERLQRRVEVLNAISNNPIFTNPRNPYALSRKDLWTTRLKQGVALLELKFKLGWSSQTFVDATKIAGDVLSLGVNFRSTSCSPVVEPALTKISIPQESQRANELRAEGILDPKGREVRDRGMLCAD